MKITILVTNMIWSFSCFNIFYSKNSLNEKTDLIVNTSDWFQSSSKIYLSNETYQKIKNNWNYFLILRTITQFPIKNQKLSSFWYQNMSKIISLKCTKSEIAQIMNQKGIIIPFVYINIVPDLILGKIVSQ